MGVINEINRQGPAHLHRLRPSPPARSPQSLPPTTPVTPPSPPHTASSSNQVRTHSSFSFALFLSSSGRRYFRLRQTQRRRYTTHAIILSTKTSIDLPTPLSLPQAPSPLVSSSATPGSSDPYSNCIRGGQRANAPIQHASTSPSPPQSPTQRQDPQLQRSAVGVMSIGAIIHRHNVMPSLDKRCPPPVSDPPQLVVTPQLTHPLP